MNTDTTSLQSLWFVVGPILGAVVMALINAGINRRHNSSQISLTDSHRGKSDTESVVLGADKATELIDKIFQAKKEALATEEELSRVRAALRDCEDEKGDCSEFREKVRMFIARQSKTLKNFINDPIFYEFEDLKERLEHATAEHDAAVVQKKSKP